MTTRLLTRAPRRERPALELAPGLGLPRARLHEACGDARATFALWLAMQTTGPVFWIAPAWNRARLNPDGMRGFVDPGRFIFVTPQRPEDVLWCMEEVLRAGAVALAVADLPAPPGLTAVRRMHLAAETGAREGGATPTGLLLTPGNGGAPGIETRWRMDGAHQREGWRLCRLRARTAPPRAWHVGGLPGPARLTAAEAEAEAERDRRSA
ncbi:ImuA family protein [Shimia sp.]|uniref:ImuA family protein n=1 Tax=Shimia sp. TaxID=1954381 RepID=UPI0035688EC4